MPAKGPAARPAHPLPAAPEPGLRQLPDTASWAPALRPRIEAVLGRGPCVLTPWRQGMDFAVFRAETGGARYALRVPLLETTHTTYDGFTDFGEVIAGEAAVHRLLADAGVPVPRLVAWERRPDGAGHSWTLSDLIEHDETAELDEEQQRSLGRLTRAVHALRPGRAPGLAALRAQGSPAALLRRTLARYRRAAELYPLPAPELMEPPLREALLRPAAARLLHMDLRASNLCFRGSRIVAVLDLANSLIGPPAAELGRVYAYGLLTPAFRDGYGGPAGGEDGLPAPRTVLAYAVDTLACLIAVAAEELADPVMLADNGRRLAAVTSHLMA
ncbi:phosphotransferase family protein [Streptomyces jumonjinensis]|uniref:Aminoglycoside phosphotransferase domain-containing protein n=1 Tax=Streptomyces jumonjinensis TaxID=1945 RepID=A0A646KTA6_STRJU|nr:phosphotransferase [Streptomyces jumonjinensis]MQT05549.1 hypothetical protein [Streptomyces jumonjinensis]